MDWPGYNFTEEAYHMIRKLDEEATSIEAKGEQLPPRLSTWCGVAVKKLSDEVKVVANIVSQEYATAPGIIQKGEMLSHLEGRLRELIEIMAKCEKFLDMLNEGSVVVGIVFRAQYLKKIKAYHDKTTITRMKISWADILRGGANREEQQPELVAEVSNLPSSQLPTTTPTLAGNGQGEGTISAQLISQGILLTPLPGSLINNIAEASLGQAAAGSLSQEAPSASLSHTRVGTMALNTVGNDVNNATVNDHSRHTGNRNTVVLNIENMVFNNFWMGNGPSQSTKQIFWRFAVVFL
ncbi:hypothetical protein BT96DRAFT_1003524 [Gymnopus androsaceus JB14]|uniref:Uncharacterized protein n=1 Tax=Gymnopus androsaceus JB14 TaxID=1447944 RepID=A0A6A4GTW2_9AGAR|nr:hypothetical protein BT96DRAFT_1003524 [Gymnopus androsaceus JB14]